MPCWLGARRGCTSREIWYVLGLGLGLGFGFGFGFGFG